MIIDDKKISSLYQQGKEQGPPAHLDSAILGAAQDAVQDAVQDSRQAKKPATAGSPFHGGWRAPASIAAVLIITVILVLYPVIQRSFQKRQILCVYCSVLISYSVKIYIVP